jgi:hypothetical protein
LQLVRRYRIPAIFCALAVLLCELIARPYTTMGICDEGPYILMARTLASTGHIVYNGFSAAMLACQLYLGVAFIKIFGFSSTTVRMSTLMVSLALAFFLQRTLVRAGINERNATLGTLALVLSPLYLMLSVTFMSDIFGLFAIVLCLYACLRALQSATDRAAILWLGFAVAINALFGTSRQIGWLGILVMVPSTLWLLRARRRVLFAGATATVLGALFILACMQWLKHQPYTTPIPLRAPNFPLAQSFEQITSLLLDIPFLLLPIVALFLPQIRKSRPRVIVTLSAFLLAYLVMASNPHFRHGIFMLEPTHGDWVSTHGFFETNLLKGSQPIFLNLGAQVLLTIASIGALLCLIASLLTSRHRSPALDSSPAAISWKHLAVLLAPYSLLYILLLFSAYATTLYLFDRYLLGLLLVALICMVRYYQERIQRRLPFACALLVVLMAVYGVIVTHNMFAFYRARVALAAELTANGIPDTSVDNGWEYNLGVELQHAEYINNSGIVLPRHAYVPATPPPAGACSMFWYDFTPHIHPIYGASFDPNVCYGPAPFAPMHYSRWPHLSPGTLYMVRYTPPSRP